MLPRLLTPGYVLLSGPKRGILSRAGLPRGGKSFARPPRKRPLPAERIVKSWISRASRRYQDARTVTATARRGASRPLQNTAAPLQNATPARRAAAPPDPVKHRRLGIGLGNEARAVRGRRAAQLTAAVFLRGARSLATKHSATMFDML